MSRQYKTLLPKTEAPERTPREWSSDRLLPKRPRIGVQIACNYCRAKKAACDGGRPQCSRCKARGINVCNYESTDRTKRTQELGRELGSLKQQLTEHETFFEHLRNLPEKDALHLLSVLRKSPDPQSIIQDVLGTMSGRQRPSDISTAGAILPRTESSLELELMLKHCTAYPQLPPIRASSIKLSKAGESILNSLGTSHAAMMATSPRDGDYVSGQWPVDGALQPFLQASLGDTGQPELVMLCDSRLLDIHLEDWTRVPISNDLAAKIISRYLQTDHPVVGAFDEDLILTDLVERQGRHCSSFLVNSIMYFACQAYTAVDKLQMTAYKIAFFTETESHWNKQRKTESAINVAAMTMFSMACVCHGKAALGTRVLQEARGMAQSLGLLVFDYNQHQINKELFRKSSAPWTRAASRAVWALYCWAGLRRLYFGDERIPLPPVLPIPGCKDHDDKSLTNSVPEVMTAMSQTFSSVCKLWIIYQEVAAISYNLDTAAGGEEHFRAAESKYQELLRWTNSLPADMARKPSCPAYIIYLHSYYHCVVLDIFRPFVNAANNPDKPRSMRLKTFTSRDSFADVVFDASINQLKRIVFDFYFLWSKESHTTWFNVALVQVADTCLRSQADCDWRLYFLLCVRCWEDLYINYPICEEILVAYLSIALRNGVLTTQEAESLRRELTAMGSHHDGTARTNFLADFELALTDRVEADSGVLAERYSELGLFVDVTQGEYVAPDAGDTGEPA